ncbi:hypothetical protein [Paenibacillus cremeus]|nr:hypothetical protein [Paenibacillus cremeus]
MLDSVKSFIPPAMIWVGAVLSGLLPYLVYRINKKLHELGDPPWKKQEP